MLIDAERWQGIGMSNTGMSTWNIAAHFNVHHTIIVRSLQRYHQTGAESDHPRSGRHRKSFLHDDIILVRRAKASSFTTASKLR